MVKSSVGVCPDTLFFSFGRFLGIELHVPLDQMDLSDPSSSARIREDERHSTTSKLHWRRLARVPTAEGLIMQVKNYQAGASRNKQMISILFNMGKFVI